MGELSFAFYLGWILSEVSQMQKKQLHESGKFTPYCEFIREYVRAGKYSLMVGPDGLTFAGVICPLEPCG